MRVVVLVMFALLTAGCASAPPLNFSVQGLGVSNSKIDADLRSISVSFAGPNEARGEIPSSGEEVPGYWESALSEGVNRISVFDDDSPQKVNIFVKVTELDIAGGGFEMTTEARATYQVVSRKSGKVLYERDISTVGSVPASYAFLGSTRIKESINRAVQKNIRAFLDALSTAKLRT
ncbi:UDP-N-acetylglucosamine acyltransferase [Pseudomonas sp. FH1]|uniref:UDP-N-acetylglucosamine acyltransferase n=1 Tax=Pseudomonas sp. FH1 TaxID=1284392 RepID=UPI0009E994E7|nr:UDP-N-acetylglucosamine acyltransferase [Pseudomonas sp. FH1]